MTSVNVDRDRHRTVVNQPDRHVGPETTGCDLDPFGQQGADHPLDQRFGLLGSGGLAERRPITPRGVGIQRELADDQDLAVRVTHGAVHLAVVVAENPETGQLGRHSVGLSGTIVVGHPDQDAQSHLDLSHDLAIYGDGGFGYPLHYCTHGSEARGLRALLTRQGQTAKAGTVRGSLWDQECR